MSDLERGAHAGAELARLEEDRRRDQNWKRWGPYLSERQWGTVREDYSALGTSWEYFPHDHSRSRAYRWGEDGLLGWCDRECRLCFAVAVWNGRDPILKERLFGLTNHEGNHGEDVKECYFYLDGTPTHSYHKALYKYPQQEFPYTRLVEENRRRSRDDREYELADTGIFDDDRYFDVFVEYAKASPDDILIRVTAWNRGPQPAPLHLLPSLWFRNTWAWGRNDEDGNSRPVVRQLDAETLLADHATLGRMHLSAHSDANGAASILFTENETNTQRLFNATTQATPVKDAFHEFVVNGRRDAIKSEPAGTKAAFHYAWDIPAGARRTVTLRLRAVERTSSPPFADFGEIFEKRRQEADDFYAVILRTSDRRVASVARQAFAGLLWSKQFYEYIVPVWLDGDPTQPPPPPERRLRRNADWLHLYCRDVLPMPDKWEFPWFASWDHAFHLVTLAEIDPELAKTQAILFLREWYMHRNGKLPAYEFALDDVNPPVHAWACWRIYKITARPGQRDRLFLERALQKLLLNFTWWVNRVDGAGRNLFAGGFLGLDNAGVFDRSLPLPDGMFLRARATTAGLAR